MVIQISGATASHAELKAAAMLGLAHTPRMRLVMLWPTAVPSLPHSTLTQSTVRSGGYIFAPHSLVCLVMEQHPDMRALACSKGWIVTLSLRWQSTVPWQASACVCWGLAS